MNVIYVTEVHVIYGSSFRVLACVGTALYVFNASFCQRFMRIDPLFDQCFE